MLYKAGPHSIQSLLDGHPLDPGASEECGPGRGSLRPQTATTTTPWGQGKYLVNRDRSPKPQSKWITDFAPQRGTLGPNDPVVLSPDHVTGFVGHKALQPCLYLMLLTPISPFSFSSLCLIRGLHALGLKHTI